MATDDVVVDVSQDWVLACDVQRRFMQGLASRNVGTLRLGFERNSRSDGLPCRQLHRTWGGIGRTGSA
jgi:hypothetical protein